MAVNSSGLYGAVTTPVVTETSPDTSTYRAFAMVPSILRVKSQLFSITT